MLRALIAAVCLAVLCAGQAFAGSIGFTTSIPQSAFRSLSKEAGIAFAYKNDAPPHPLGITGFDAGVEMEFVDIKKESDYWNNAFGGSATATDKAPAYLILPKVRVRKGLPFGIDVGAMYSNGGNTPVQLYGVEVAKSILAGTVATPALGVRATYTRLAGVNDIDLQTVGIDASIGKGILVLTPYAGAGMVWIDSKATGNLQRLSALAGAPLGEEKIWQPRFFGGVEVKPLPFIRVLGEIEYSLRPIYSLKAAIGF